VWQAAAGDFVAEQPVGANDADRGIGLRERHHSLDGLRKKPIIGEQHLAIAALGRHVAQGFVEIFYLP
jgi:hypothetical protein